jgi:hypothetical protein
MVDGVDVVVVGTMAAVRWFFFALQKCRISVSTSKLFVDDKVSLAIYNMKDFVILYHSLPPSSCPLARMVYLCSLFKLIFVYMFKSLHRGF